MGSCLSADNKSPKHASSPSSPGLGIRKRNSKKTSWSKNNSLNSRWLELRKIPGRLFLNGSSEIASLFSQQGKKGTNQDAMIVWENFGSRTDTVFCGVFDGHGPHGHLVAKRVRDVLPLKLSVHYETNLTCEDMIRKMCQHTSTNMIDEYYNGLKHVTEVGANHKQLEVINSLKESFFMAFEIMDRELKAYSDINCFCSGTTAVTMIKQGDHLIIGNVGDSRAVLGTRDEVGSLIPVQLTVDLKPNLPEEAARIEKCHGRVFALKDEPEVARVWLPNNDSPGLAMARAFGDFCLKDFGLISVPDISHRSLTEKDEFIVLATDGIWDVLSNKEVVDIVESSSRSVAAQALVRAIRAWRFKYPTSKIDDWAVVCLFLDSNNVTSASTLEPDRVPIGRDEPSFSSSRRETDSDPGVEWLALEGVSRANTILNIPRFRGETKVRNDPGGVSRNVQRNA